MTLVKLANNVIYKYACHIYTHKTKGSISNKMDFNRIFTNL